MKRAALYLRVSTDGQTIENQRAPLEQLADARGWNATVYEETASGVKARPELERLTRDAHAGAVHVVAVVALDRLGRNMHEVLARVRELDACGCSVVSLRESWLDLGGPARALLIAIFGWLAEEERRILVERTRAGLERARREGTRLGRPPASLIHLGAAARRVAQGETVRGAARKEGVSPRTLRRHLAAVNARQEPREAASRGKNPRS